MCTDVCLEHLNPSIQGFGSVGVVQVPIFKGVFYHCSSNFDRDFTNSGQWGVDASLLELLSGVVGWVLWVVLVVMNTQAVLFKHIMLCHSYTQAHTR